LHEFPHVKGCVATAIVSKVFDVIGKLLSCQFNDAFIKVGDTLMLCDFICIVTPYTHPVLYVTTFCIVEPKRCVHLY